MCSCLNLIVQVQVPKYENVIPIPSAKNLCTPCFGTLGENSKYRKTDIQNLYAPCSGTLDAWREGPQLSSDAHFGVIASGTAGLAGLKRDSQDLRRIVIQGLLSWLLEGGFKVSTGTVTWYSSFAADFDNSEIASRVILRNRRKDRGMSDSSVFVLSIMGCKFSQQMS